MYLIELSDKSGPNRIENRKNLQVCRSRPIHANNNDSDSSEDDDPIAIGYSGYRTIRRTTSSTAGKHLS